MATRVYQWSSAPASAANVNISFEERKPVRGNTLVCLVSTNDDGNGVSEIQTPTGWLRVRFGTGDMAVGVFVRVADGRERDEGPTWDWVGGEVVQPVALMVEYDRAAVGDIEDAADDQNNLDPPYVGEQPAGNLAVTEPFKTAVTVFAGQGVVWQPGQISAPESFEYTDAVNSAGSLDGTHSFAERQVTEPLVGEPVWLSELEVPGGASYGATLIFRESDTALRATAEYVHNIRGSLKRRVDYSLQLITGPTEPLFSVEDAKVWLRIDDCPGDVAGQDEDLLELLINAVRDEIDGDDGEIGRALQRQTWRMTIDAFPVSRTGTLAIPLTSEQNVGDNPLVVVRYVDTDAEVQRFADFEIMSTSDPLLIAPGVDAEWPRARLQERAVEIVFEAGYRQIPEDIITYAKYRLGQFWEFRELVVAGVKPEAVPFVQFMLERYRARWYDPTFQP